MADIAVNLYRSEVVRFGTIPSNPSNPEDEPLEPVNPPGSVNTGIPDAPFDGKIKGRRNGIWIDARAVEIEYPSQANMLANQAEQEAGRIYFDGTADWIKKATSTGDISDYRPLGGGGGFGGAGAGLSIDGSGKVQWGNDGAGVIKIGDEYDIDSSILFEYYDLGNPNPLSIFIFERSSIQLSSLEEIGLDTFSSGISISPNGFTLRKQINSNVQSLSMGSSSGDIIRVTDQINSKGLEYADDYSANWTDHSLITKKWVEDNFGGGGGGIAGTIDGGQIAYGTGADTIGGNNSLWWDATNSRLGVGTSTPSTALEVINDATITGANGLIVRHNSGILGARLYSISDGRVFLASRDNNFVGIAANLTVEVARFYPSGFMAVGAIVPTNTLDVNGTARVRTIANLGTSATSVLVPSATGVLSFRTLSQLASDANIPTQNVQTVPTTGTINDLLVTESTVIFTGSGAVTLTGIVALADGREITIVNSTGFDLVFSPESGSSVTTNRFLFNLTLPTNSSLKIKYRLNRWINLYGSFVPSQTGQNGTYTLDQVGIRVNTQLNVALKVRANGNTASQYAGLFENSSGISQFIVGGDGAYFPTLAFFGGVSVISNVRVVVKNISGGFPFAIQNTAGTYIISTDNSGNLMSSGSGSFGVTPLFNSIPARLVSRGAGTGTGITLLLEDSTGKDNIQFLDNGNIVFATTGGTRIGTDTNQLISFWNKTPIVQPTNAIGAGAFVANTSGIANDTATFGGYTIGQIVQALINVGLLA